MVLFSPAICLVFHVSIPVSDSYKLPMTVVTGMFALFSTTLSESGGTAVVGPARVAPALYTSKQAVSQLPCYHTTPESSSCSKGHNSSQSVALYAGSGAVYSVCQLPISVQWQGP